MNTDPLDRPDVLNGVVHLAPQSLNLAKASKTRVGFRDSGFRDSFGSFRSALFWGPCNKDPTNLGYFIRVPYFRKLPFKV